MQNKHINVNGTKQVFSASQQERVFRAVGSPHTRLTSVPTPPHSTNDKHNRFTSPFIQLRLGLSQLLRAWTGFGVDTHFFYQMQR